VQNPGSSSAYGTKHGTNKPAEPQLELDLGLDFQA